MLPLAAAQADPEPGRDFADWRIGCEAKPDGSGDACFAFQNQMQGDKLVLSVKVGYLGPKREVHVVVDLPLGLNLQAGAAILLNGNRHQLRYETCMATGCRAISSANRPLMSDLIAARSLVVGAVPYGVSQTLNMPVSTNGLADALRSLR